MAARVLLLLALLLAVSGVAAAGESRSTPRLRSDARAVCEQFVVVSEFVVANCSSPQFDALDANCLESFELFYETPNLLIACEQRERDAAAKARMVRFMEIYTAWQKHHACELFHAKEERAARRCGGAAVQKPWHEEAFPLYCDEIFQLYKNNRETLDAACARTPFSDAFWEAYADYVASPLCKTYYRHVRDATPRGCADKAEKADAAACEAMFQWYTQHRDHVERECLEVQGAKPFYKGFYAWKHRQEA